MSQLQRFKKQLVNEALVTRKMLSRLPEDKYDWKPHAKSMTLLQLATHIAELPSWIGMVLNTEELDFASSPYSPTPINNNKEIIDYFETCQSQGESDLGMANENELEKTWVLRTGEQIHSKDSKDGMISMTLCQITHHRAQLGVYLRLLDIPIPGSYGPSADEPEFN